MEPPKNILNESFMVKYSLAQETRRKSLLKQLVQDSNWEIRSKVAENPATPASVLKQLAADVYPWIRKLVAIHENTGVATLHKLANDKVWWVREALVYRTQCPQEIIIKLIEDDSPIIVNAILNQKFDTKIIEIGLKSKNKLIVEDWIKRNKTKARKAITREFLL